jgi:hypothetical protein
VITSTLYGQSVDEVINKHIETMGGLEKLKSIKSLQLQGVAVMPNGNEITSKIYKVQDKLYRREIESPMGTITIIVTDKEGWFSNPRNGGAFEALPADAVKNQQSELDCAGPLVDYAAKGHKAELIGKEDVEGTECYKIKLTLKSGQDLTYFIDTKNHYIIRQSFKGRGMFGGGAGGGRPGGGRAGDDEVRIDYSNYLKTPEGYTFAHTVSIGGMGSNITYEKIEVNKPVDEKLYKPGSK